MNAKQATMKGPELVGKVIALEGFLMVVTEHLLDDPSISPERAKGLLMTMAKNAKELAADINHTEMQTYVETQVDDFVKRLMDALPKMRDSQ